MERKLSSLRLPLRKIALGMPTQTGKFALQILESLVFSQTSYYKTGKEFELAVAQLPVRN